MLSDSGTGVTNTVHNKQNFALQKPILRPMAPRKSLAQAGAPKPTGLGKNTPAVLKSRKNFPKVKSLSIISLWLTAWLEQVNV